MKQKEGFCLDCTDGIEKPLIAKRCEFHYWQFRQNVNSKKNPKQKKDYKIPKVSQKMKVRNLQYQVLRIEFLGKKENQICPITKTKTTDIHHKKGRIGSLLLDTRYWVALSREGHKYVEEHPDWAKENGYSLSRLSNT